MLSFGEFFFEVFMIRLFVLVLFFSAFSSFAFEKCSLSLKSISDTYKDQYGLITTRMKRRYRPKLAKSWHECFEYAVNEASKLNMSTDSYYAKYQFLNEEGKLEGKILFFDYGYLFIEWTFDDSIFFDTSGKVNKYTKKYYPTDGDARVTKDGYLLVR